MEALRGIELAGVGRHQGEGPDVRPHGSRNFTDRIGVGFNDGIGGRGDVHGHIPYHNHRADGRGSRFIRNVNFRIMLLLLGLLGGLGVICRGIRCVGHGCIFDRVRLLLVPITGLAIQSVFHVVERLAALFRAAAEINGQIVVTAAGIVIKAIELPVEVLQLLAEWKRVGIIRLHRLKIRAILQGRSRKTPAF